jgi:hypothetical protein
VGYHLELVQEIGFKMIRAFIVGDHAAGLVGIVRRERVRAVQKKACAVGQITCIYPASQQSGPRRETGRGLFQLRALSI